MTRGLTLIVALGVSVGGLTSTGCGSDDGHGVASTKKLAELSDTELDALCKWAVETSGGVICEDGTDLEPLTLAECKKNMRPPAGCEATVADSERCLNYVGKDCEGVEEAGFASACGAVFACSASDDAPAP